LRNVAPKYRHKKRGDGPTNLRAILPPNNQPKPEQNFDDTRCQHYEVGIIFEQCRHLCSKLDTICAEVRKAREHEPKAQDDLRDFFHLMQLSTSTGAGAPGINQFKTVSCTLCNTFASFRTGTYANRPCLAVGERFF